MVDQLTYKPPIGKSDHVVILFDYICNAERSSDCFKQLRRTNFEGLQLALTEVTQWGSAQTTVNAHWKSFITCLQSQIDINSRSIPKRATICGKSVLRSRTKKWIRLRNHEWFQYKTSKTGDNWERFRAIRNKVTTMIREDKDHYQIYLAGKMERNPKILYRLVNARSKAKPGIPSIQTSSGMTTTAYETAEALAKFYCTVFSPKEVIHSANTPDYMTQNILTDVPFTSEMIARRLRNIKLGTSPGADGITPLILRKCVSPLSQPLAEFFSHSMNQGLVPTEWKCGIISPIYKGGGQTLAGNYRPVTLLPIISKVMERMVADAIRTHLEENRILSKAQHGFRNHFSCLTNLLTALNDWTEAVDRRECVHACYLDISKAFDRVNHILLVEKLKNYGISGNLLSWLQDYLTDRYVQVQVDGALSERIPVTSGVPQGSVLGPILFLLFVNDIPELIHSRILLFADDIKIWTRVKNVEDCYRLQHDLDALSDWSLKNKLPFNLKKCKMLQLGTSHNYSYHLGSMNLEWASEEKDLGVWITSSLKSERNCVQVYNKTSRILGMLRRVFGHFTHKTLTFVMNTYLRPVMEYAIQAWAPWQQKDKELFQRIYHRATKSVIGLHAKTYEERIKILDLFDSNYRRIRGDLILMYNIQHSSDHPLKSLFKPGSERVTRQHRFSVEVPSSRSNCRRHFFAVRVCFVWNSLPDSIVNSLTLESFKFALDHHMRTHTICEP